MNASELLANVQIASPCRARWEDMTGDERSRYCGQCSKHVYNFNAMTTEEAAKLIRANEGKLYGRFYRRRDGTMLTTNCPVGHDRYVARLIRLASAAVGLFLTSLGVMAINRTNPDREPGPLAEKCDEIAWRVKGWFGRNPPMMGMIVNVGPPANPPATTVNNGNSGNTAEADSSH